MRDLERWKDKVEISLDGRQIFFLFFGSAVAACLIFVLGVLIGKRLEVYEAQTKPLIEYYEKSGLLRVVDGDADVQTVFARLKGAV